jgi:hypothetical protein
MPNKKGIPNSILAPLQASGWMHDDYSVSKFQTQLDGHAEGDRLDGMTCAYNIEAAAGLGLITLDELKAMVRENAVQPDFVDGTQVNQHWLHSLEQFYAVTYREWLAHLKRTNALIGTAQGRIRRESEAA